MSTSRQIYSLPIDSVRTKQNKCHNYNHNNHTPNATSTNSTLCNPILALESFVRNLTSQHARDAAKREKLSIGTCYPFLSLAHARFGLRGAPKSF